MKKQNDEAAPATPKTVTSFSSASGHPATISPSGKPMYSGTVIAEYKRCGKASCRCAKGDLHGPYFYLFRRVGGRLRRTYLRPGDVEAARSACAEWRQMKAYLLNQRRETMMMFRELRQSLREIRKGAGY